MHSLSFDGDFKSRINKTNTTKLKCICRLFWPTLLTSHVNRQINARVGLSDAVQVKAVPVAAQTAFGIANKIEIKESALIEFSTEKGWSC